MKKTLIVLMSIIFIQNQAVCTPLGFADFTLKNQCVCTSVLLASTPIIYTTGISGNLTASANKNIYIKSDKDIALDKVNSGETVNMEILGKITNGAFNGQSNITSNIINLNAENIGERDNNLGISLTGADSIVNMNAEDSLYVDNVSETQDFNIGIVEAGNNAVISSETGDIVAFDENSYISANNIEFDAKNGNIGSQDNKLKVTDFDLVSGHANGNIDLEVITPDSLGLEEALIRHPELVSGSAVYNIGDIKSDNGYIDMYSSDSGINLKGIVDAKESINADIYGNITDDAGNDTAGFYSDKINLISETGSIGTSDNSIRIGASLAGHSVLDTESTLNADAINGIYIESHDTIVADKVESNADVRLESEEDIKAKPQEDESANITANNIELTAGQNIGEKDNRLVTEITTDKGRTNLKANGNIYLKQNGTNRFYSDYVINTGNGATDLLVPDNSVFIIDLEVANPSLFKIDFTGMKYKKEISIGFNDLKKLTIDPTVTRKDDEEDPEEESELLRSFKYNIYVSPDVFKFPANIRLSPLNPLISKNTTEKKTI